MAEQAIPAKNMAEWLHQIKGKTVSLLVNGPLGEDGMNEVTGTVDWVGTDALILIDPDGERLYPFANILELTVLHN